MFAAETVEIFIPFIPGPLITDLLIIIIAPILGFFILFYALAPVWAKILIKIHKILSRVGTDAKYGVIRTGKRVTGRMLLFRAMVVSFFTFSISVFLVELLNKQGFIVNLTWVKRRINKYFEYSMWGTDDDAKLWRRIEEGIEEKEYPLMAEEEFHIPAEVLVNRIEALRQIEAIYFNEGLAGVCNLFGCERKDSEGRYLRRLINEGLGWHEWLLGEEKKIFDRLDEKHEQLIQELSRDM